MSRRIQVIVSLLFLAFFGVIVRIGLLTVDESVKLVGQTQGARTITVAELRGTIYDRHLATLVNSSDAYYATLIPEERMLHQLGAAIDSTEYNRVKAAIGSGSPILVKLKRTLSATTYLRVYQTKSRYDSHTLAPHLLGYVSGPNGRGASGIEKAYDAVLSQYTGLITATYPMNGHGTYTTGDEVEVINTSYKSAGGVVLTLDSSIQRQVEEILSSSVNKGAAVVMKPNGEILAMSSFPDFHPDTVSDNLNRTDGALINRTLSVYDCGSVFKIVTALSALENGVSPQQDYECAGSLTVDNNVFHCHNRSGHHTLTMEEAFAQSCNLYFIQLAREIGAEEMLKMTDRLGLTSALPFADSLTTADPVIPPPKDLSADAALANFSFGQGRLLLSPLHIARLTAAVVNDGILPNVTSVIGTIDEYKQWTTKSERGGEAVFSADFASELRHMMELVVSEGTGRRAKPDHGEAAGKTGTAETGRLQDGRVAINSWFTGYYPAEDPQYVITVLVEDAEDRQKDASEIFCEIINKIG